MTTPSLLPSVSIADLSWLSCALLPEFRHSWIHGWLSGGVQIVVILDLKGTALFGCGDEGIKSPVEIEFSALVNWSNLVIVVCLKHYYLLLGHLWDRPIAFFLDETSCLPCICHGSLIIVKPTCHTESSQLIWLSCWSTKCICPPFNLSRCWGPLKQKIVPIGIILGTFTHLLEWAFVLCSFSILFCHSTLAEPVDGICCCLKHHRSKLTFIVVVLNLIYKASKASLSLRIRRSLSVCHGVSYWQSLYALRTLD